MKTTEKIMRRSERGFTLVELMVVVALSMIAFLAVLYLQTSLIRGTANTWDMTTATGLARHTLETIRLEATEWYNDTGLGIGGVQQAKFAYLSNVGAPNAGGGSGWLRAPYANAAATFQQTAQLGDNPAWDIGAATEITNATNQRFCVQYRLTWLVPNYLIRAEARVLWPRQDAPAGNFDACPADMFNHPTDIYSITMPMTVMKNVFVSP
ncbi:MAG TPA: type II secretion system protein [Myxococcota bacterium]|nr:type II secretion system protein [Myxococcota bacterium]HQP95236.1 type II secretion system protein [Myxococcota bacterium]